MIPKILINKYFAFDLFVIAKFPLKSHSIQMIFSKCREMDIATYISDYSAFEDLSAIHPAVAVPGAVGSYILVDHTLTPTPDIATKLPWYGYVQLSFTASEKHKIVI